MEWISLALAGVVLVLIATPVVLLLATVFVLVPLALVAPAAPAVARTAFSCPVTRRNVTAAFLTRPGEAEPADILACSLFPDGVRCEKACLRAARTSWTPSTSMARFALLAGGESVRDAA